MLIDKFILYSKYMSISNYPAACVVLLPSGRGEFCMCPVAPRPRIVGCAEYRPGAFSHAVPQYGAAGPPGPGAASPAGRTALSSTPVGLRASARGVAGRTRPCMQAGLPGRRRDRVGALSFPLGGPVPRTSRDVGRPESRPGRMARDGRCRQRRGWPPEVVMCRFVLPYAVGPDDRGREGWSWIRWGLASGATGAGRARVQGGSGMCGG